jgi:hypothetical protein
VSAGHDHFIARCHLRGFSLDGKHLVQLDLGSGRSVRVSIADAAVERGLNTILVRGERNRDLEGFMADVESEVAPILERLRAEPTGIPSLSSTENDVLSVYTALAYARSPQWREGLPARSAKAVQMVAEDLERDRSTLIARVRAAGGTYGPAEELKVQGWLEKLRAGDVPPELDTPQWLISVDSATRKAAAAVQLMTKIVVHDASRAALVLGDCPVILMRDGAFYKASGMGLTSEGVRVAMPLSGECLLVATFTSRSRADALVGLWRTSSMAMFVNRASLAHAERFAFGRSERELQTAFRSFKRNPLR